MDLGSIRQKLDSRDYTSAKDCIADFELMFSNCFAYNNTGEVSLYLACILNMVLN